MFYQKYRIINGVTCVDVGPSPWNLERLTLQTPNSNYRDRAAVRDQLYRKAMYELALYSISPLEALEYLRTWNDRNARPLSFKQLIKGFIKELPGLISFCSILEPEVEYNIIP